MLDPRDLPRVAKPVLAVGARGGDFTHRRCRKQPRVQAESVVRSDGGLGTTPTPGARAAVVRILDFVDIVDAKDDSG